MKNTQRSVFKISVIFTLLFGISSCCDHEEKIVKVDEPKEIIIPIEQAKEMYDTYSERREDLIQDFENSLDSLDNRDEYDKKMQQNQNQKDEDKSASIQQQSEKGFQAVRYIDYNFENLKQYMAFVEQEAKKADVNISTLRFYLANYPDKEKFEGANGRVVKDRRRNTVVMVPALNKGGKEYAFYTADDDKDGKRKAYLLTNELEDNESAFTEGSIKEKASLMPSWITFSPYLYLPPQNKQSLYGNEGGSHP